MYKQHVSQKYTYICVYFIYIIYIYIYIYIYICLCTVYIYYVNKKFYFGCDKLRLIIWQHYY